MIGPHRVANFSDRDVTVFGSLFESCEVLVALLHLDAREFCVLRACNLLPEANLFRCEIRSLRKSRMTFENFITSLHEREFELCLKATLVDRLQIGIGAGGDSAKTHRPYGLARLAAAQPDRLDKRPISRGSGGGPLVVPALVPGVVRAGTLSPVGDCFCMLFPPNRFGVAKACSAAPHNPWLDACGAGRWSEFVALTPTLCRRGRSVHMPRFHASSQGYALATLSPSGLPMIILPMTSERFGWSTLG